MMDEKDVFKEFEILCENNKEIKAPDKEGFSKLKNYLDMRDMYNSNSSLIAFIVFILAAVSFVAAFYIV